MWYLFIANLTFFPKVLPWGKKNKNKCDGDSLFDDIRCCNDDELQDSLIFIPKSK